MEPTYYVLQVTVSDEETIAVLPLVEVADRELNEQVHADFALLAASGTQPLVVDLRAVVYCSGSFISHLIQLHKALASRARPYTMLVSADLRKVLAITRLDELLPIVDGPGIISCERANRGKKAAQLKAQPTPAPHGCGSFFQRCFAWLRPNVKR